MTDPTTDLKLLSALTFASVVAILSGVGSGTSIAVFVAFPLLFLVPGYATLAALLPSSRPTASPSCSTIQISGIEWWLLSVSLSLVVVPVVAISVIAVPLEFGPYTLATLLGVVSGVALAVAARRRKQVHVTARHAPGLSLGAPIRRVFRTDSPIDVVLSVALFASLLLVAASGFYAMSVEPHQSEYTELYVLTGNGTVEFQASEYPTEIEPGAELTFSVGVENHEGSVQEYTIIVQEQRLDGDEIVERSRHDRLSFRLRDGKTEVTTHTVQPAAEDSLVKITYLLFRTGSDGIPATPTEEDAYRRAFIRLEVLPADSGGGSTAPPNIRIEM